MAKNQFPRQKSKGEPSEDKRSSSHNSNGSKDAPFNIKDQQKTFKADTGFSTTVGDFKDFDSKIHYERYSNIKGIRKCRKDVNKAIENLVEISEILVNKFVAVHRFTKKNKDCKEYLKSANKARRREQKQRRIFMRASPQETLYKPRYSKLSDKDDSSLEEYKTKGFKPEDAVLMRNGLREQLTKCVRDLLENIKWDEDPEHDWDSGPTISDVSRQEVGRIEGRVNSQEVGRIKEKPTRKEVGMIVGRLSSQEVGRIEGRVSSQETGRIEGRVSSQETGRIEGRVSSQEVGRIEGRVSSQEVGRIKEKPTRKEVGRIKEKPTRKEVGMIVGRLSSQEIGRMEERLGSQEVGRIEGGVTRANIPHYAPWEHQTSVF